MKTLTKPLVDQITFTVNDFNGKLKQGIKHCFLSIILIDAKNPPSVIRGNNGLIYQAVYDNFQVPVFANPIVEVIASFQAWEDGNFVVLRNIQKKV